MTGKPLPLLSKFRLSYYTLLNILRRLEGSGQSMEYVIARSFQQFQYEQSLPQVSRACHTSSSIVEGSLPYLGCLRGSHLKPGLSNRCRALLHRPLNRGAKVWWRYESRRYSARQYGKMMRALLLHNYSNKAC